MNPNRYLSLDQINALFNVYRSDCDPYHWAFLLLAHVAVRHQVAVRLSGVRW